MVNSIVMSGWLPHASEPLCAWPDFSSSHRISPGDHPVRVPFTPDAIAFVKYRLTGESAQLHEWVSFVRNAASRMCLPPKGIRS